MSKSRWHSVNGIKFMKDMLYNGLWEANEEVTLTLKRKADTSSRMWVTLSWLASDGKRQEVSASTFELAFERACEREMQIENLLKEEPKE